MFVPIWQKTLVADAVKGGLECQFFPLCIHCPALPLKHRNKVYNDVTVSTVADATFWYGMMPFGSLVKSPFGNMFVVFIAGVSI